MRLAARGRLPLQLLQGAMGIELSASGRVPGGAMPISKKTTSQTERATQSWQGWLCSFDLLAAQSPPCTTAVQGSDAFVSWLACASSRICRSACRPRPTEGTQARALARSNTIRSPHFIIVKVAPHVAMVNKYRKPSTPQRTPQKLTR